jgi:DnaJ-class molecular chaperone
MPKPKRCPACAGKGKTPTGETDKDGKLIYRTCGLCRGSGSYTPPGRG